MPGHPFCSKHLQGYRRDIIYYHDCALCCHLRGSRLDWTSQHLTMAREHCTPARGRRLRMVVRGRRGLTDCTRTPWELGFSFSFFFGFVVRFFWSCFGFFCVWLSLPTISTASTI